MCKCAIIHSRFDGNGTEAKMFTKKNAIRSICMMRQLQDQKMSVALQKDLAVRNRAAVIMDFKRFGQAFMDEENGIIARQCKQFCGKVPGTIALRNGHQDDRTAN